MSFQKHIQSINLPLEEIHKFKDLEKGDLVLVLDDGRVRGIDHIVEVREDGTYDYLKKDKKVFQGNFHYYKKQGFTYYKTNEDVYKYTDEKLNEAFLSMEYFFEDTYGENAGSFLRASFYERVIKNFVLRTIFIEWTIFFKEELSIFRFKEWEGCQVTDDALFENSKLLKKAIDEDIFSIKNYY